jgi:hypothetical protein
LAFTDAKLAGDLVEAERLKGEVKTTNDEVQRANAEYQRVSALKSQSLEPKRAVGGAVRSVPSDPLERLEKLADLRDRGCPVRRGVRRREGEDPERRLSRPSSEPQVDGGANANSLLASMRA